MNKQTLIDCGALLEGHFKLSSGLHSDKFVQCAKILQTFKGFTAVKDAVYGLLVSRPDFFKDIDVVIGGAYGGIRISQLIAMSLSESCGKEVRGIFCERIPRINIDKGLKVTERVLNKGVNANTALVDMQESIESGPFKLRRGFEIKPGEKVLIAEDVTTTGKSVGEITNLAVDKGGQVMGAISIIDRRKTKEDHIHIPQWDDGVLNNFFSLMEMDITTWKPEDCPLCKDSEAIKPGSRS